MPGRMGIHRFARTDFLVKPFLQPRCGPTPSMLGPSYSQTGLTSVHPGCVLGHRSHVERANAQPSADSTIRYQKVCEALSYASLTTFVP